MDVERINEISTRPLFLTGLLCLLIAFGLRKLQPRLRRWSLKWLIGDAVDEWPELESLLLPVCLRNWSETLFNDVLVRRSGSNAHHAADTPRRICATGSFAPDVAMDRLKKATVLARAVEAPLMLSVTTEGADAGGHLANLHDTSCEPRNPYAPPSSVASRSSAGA